MTKPLGIIAYTALETLPCLFLLINLLCEDGFQTAGFWWLSSIRLCSACGGANLCFGHQLCRPEQSVGCSVCPSVSSLLFGGGLPLFGSSPSTQVQTGCLSCSYCAGACDENQRCPVVNSIGREELLDACSRAVCSLICPRSHLMARYQACSKPLQVD